MHGTLPARVNDVAAQIGPPAHTLLRFITCGSVDDGKSTLIGRLLYDTNSVFDDQLEALGGHSRKFGTQGTNLDFALLLDGLAAEREQGITIDVAYRHFSTQQRVFIVADTPGHEQYTRNMATGASTAELAIILIDARKGVLPQTRRHSFIVSMLGVRSIVLAINKMDLVDFSEAVFERSVADYRAATESLGFDQIICIPISARDGDNVTTVSHRTPWYDGPTLLSHLETVEPETTAQSDGPFVCPVQWVNRPDLDFRGYAGTIAGGIVRRGMEVAVLPGGRRTQIARIIGADGERESAQAGEAVTLCVADEIDISRGDVLAGIPCRLQPRHAVTGHLLWMIDDPLVPDRDYTIQSATVTANVRVGDLHHVIDVETFAERPAKMLAMNQIGLVSLVCDRALVVNSYRHDRELGAFILIDRRTNQTAALGTFDLTAIHAAKAALSQPTARSVSSHVDNLRGIAGERGSLRRKNLVGDVAASLVAAIALALIVWFFSGRLAAMVAVLIFDIIARPLLRRFAMHMARFVERRVGSDVNESGAGI